ncbi:hypothetical protein HDU78_007584 [Chytriomyces hyalinus]|nr:hypothetical protein HDU78_007584 [Chytriomyces hyalinus]
MMGCNTDTDTDETARIVREFEEEFRAKLKTRKPQAKAGPEKDALNQFEREMLSNLRRSRRLTRTPPPTMVETPLESSSEIRLMREPAQAVVPVDCSSQIPTDVVEQAVAHDSLDVTVDSASDARVGTPLKAESTLYYSDLASTDVESALASPVRSAVATSTNSLYNSPSNLKARSDQSLSSSLQVLRPNGSVNSIAESECADSSPLAVSFTSTAADSPSEQHRYHARTVSLDPDDDFPLHTVSHNPKSASSVSPVSTTATIKALEQLDMQAVDTSDQETDAMSTSRRNPVQRSPVIRHKPLSRFLPAPPPEPSPALDSNLAEGSRTSTLPGSDGSTLDAHMPLPSASPVVLLTSSRFTKPFPWSTNPHANKQTQLLARLQHQDLIQELEKTQSRLQESTVRIQSLESQVDSMQTKFDVAVGEEVTRIEHEYREKYLETVDMLHQQYQDRQVELEQQHEEWMEQQHQQVVVASPSISAAENLMQAQKIESLQIEMQQMMDDKKSCDEHILQLQTELEEATHRDQMQSNQIKQILAILEQSNEERSTIHEQLVQEKAKNARSEEEFRLFSKKLRSLQEIISELRVENDELRTELRKLQYEGHASTERDDYYRSKLEQARFDNESLRAVITSLTTQASGNDFRPASSASSNSNSPLPFRAAVTSSAPLDVESPFRRKQSMPNLRGGVPPNGVQFNSTFTPPVKKHAWSSSSSSSFSSPSRSATRFANGVSGGFRATPNQSDRERFMDKLRRYEEEEEDDDENVSELHAQISLLENGTSSKQHPQQQHQQQQQHALQERRSVKSFDGSQVGALLGSGNRDDGGRGRNPAGENGTMNGGFRRMSTGSDSIEGANSVDYIALREEFDAQLKVLMERKASLTSELQRIPTSSGASRRRRKEQLDDELDSVEKAIGACRMKMRNANLL